MKFTITGIFSALAVILDLLRHVVPRGVDRKAQAASVSILDPRAAPCPVQPMIGLILIHLRSITCYLPRIGLSWGGGRGSCQIRPFVTSLA